MILNEFLSRLDRVKGSAGQFTARCPGHEDKENSLSISQGDKGIVLKCHAGCATADIVGALELRVSDLFDKPLTADKSRSRIVATYDYTDADGTLRYQVVRKQPKDFRQRQPDPDKPGEWIWNLKGVERVLYNLPAVMAAIEAGKKIFLCEGEKDVESLRAIGLTGTTNAGGAAKWHKSYTDILRQTTVIILPDNDDPGRAHARLVHSQLPNSTIVELPDLPIKGDVTDWIKTGGTREALIELAQLAEEQAPPIGLNAKDFRLSDTAKLISGDIPPVEFLFEDMIPTGIVGAIIARGGVGKSWLMLTLALSVATGEVLLPFLKPTDGDGVSVLFLAAEDPETIIAHRLQAIIKAYPKLDQCKDKIVANFSIISDQCAPIMQVNDRNTCKSSNFQKFVTVVNHTNPAFIIIDPIAQFAGIDENDNAAATALVVVLKELAAITKATLLFTHHTSKALSETQHQNAARGATALLDACRFAANLKHLDTNMANGFGVQCSDYVVFDVTKSSYAPQLPAPIYMCHAKGGAFVVADLQRSKIHSIAEGLVEALVAIDAPPVTARDILKSPKFKELRAELKANYEATRTDIEKAIPCALELGLLESVSSFSGRNSVQMIRVVKESSYE